MTTPIEQINVDRLGCGHRYEDYHLPPGWLCRSQERAFAPTKPEVRLAFCRRSETDGIRLDRLGTGVGGENLDRATDLLAGQLFGSFEGLADRQFEIWERLVGIADLVGGDWPS